MRRLLLLRHAKAERAEPGQGDLGRALLDDGRRDAETIGLYLARHRYRPDVILVSPAMRTRETFMHAATALVPSPLPTFDPRIYDAAPATLLHVVKEVRDDAQTVLMIGHNPGIQDFATLVIGTGDIDTRERLREKFPTAGLAVIDFVLDGWAKIHARSGRLERFIEPKLIARPTH